jgi:hypothetical protein
MTPADRERMEQLLRERNLRQTAWRIFERSTRESAFRLIRKTHGDLR